MGFLETIAENDLHHESDRFAELSTGYLAMRASCSALEGVIDRYAIHVAYRDAKKLGRVQIRTVLTTMVGEIPFHPDTRPHWKDILLSRMMTLGHALHSDGEFIAAIDVFDTISSTIGCPKDLRMSALQAKGFACRMAHRFDDARFAYHQLRHFAIRKKSRRMRIEADLGLAKVTGQTGNIPEWERQLNRVIADAERVNDRDLLEKAYVDRAYAASERQRWVEVLQYSYLTLEVTRDAGRRTRAYVNMAGAFRWLREYEAAKSIAESVWSSDAPIELKLAAGQTLYAIEIDAKQWRRARRARRALRAISRTPGALARYYELAAFEFVERAMQRTAMKALDLMARVSEGAGLFKLSVRAGEALDQIKDGRTPSDFLAGIRPPEIQRTKKVVAEIASRTAELICA